MQKILFVITKSNWGGAQRYVFDLATSLPKEEFAVAVAHGQPGKLAMELARAGVPTHTVASLQRNVSLAADIKSLLELYRLYKREQPDVVHLNSSKAGGVGALAARLAGVPKIVFTAHGWPFWEPRGTVARAAIWFFSWLTALLSHNTIVISDFDLRVARRMPLVGHKAVRIYNGIDPHLELGSGECIRNAFPPHTQITGTIGELTKNKNHQALIEQAKNDPSLHVAIVGEGEERPALEAAIHQHHLGDRVKLFGFMPAREVLRGFDRFVLPSLKEGLPYVLLEARLAGLPIEANRVGGVSEILDSADPSAFLLEQMVQSTIRVYRS